MSELSGISTIESFEMTSAICIFITFLCNVSFEFLFHVFNKNHKHIFKKHYLKNTFQYFVLKKINLR